MGMTHFPQYDWLVAPPILYGVPAAYVVLAIAGNFAMRSRPAFEVGFAMKLYAAVTLRRRRRRSPRHCVPQVQRRADRALRVHGGRHAAGAWLPQHFRRQLTLHRGVHAPAAPQPVGPVEACCSQSDARVSAWRRPRERRSPVPFESTRRTARSPLLARARHSQIWATLACPVASPPPHHLACRRASGMC